MKFRYIAKNPTISGVSRRVPGAGLEPARYCYQRILSLLRFQAESAVLSQNITKNYEVSFLINTWHEKMNELETKKPRLKARLNFAKITAYFNNTIFLVSLNSPA